MRAWESYIKKVVPYVPGEQPNVAGMIKLNTNENPYPPAPGVERILKTMDVDTLRLYPDPTVGNLISELASYYQVNENQIFVGVGSDDVLAMALMTYFNSDLPVLFPDITYSFYPVWCDLFQIPYEQLPLDSELRIRREDYYRKNGGIILANPNAPTSICEDLSFIEDIVRNNQDSIVIVDEAYIDFAGRSAIKLLQTYENIIVVQTFSKSRSMAGMRIGFAIGSEKLIKCLHDVKYAFNSYTINQPSIVAGIEAVKDVEYFNATIHKVLETRDRAEKRFKELGFSFPKSGANFLFVTHDHIPAKDIYLYLRKQHIYVRYFSLPRIDNYLRITIGTEEEMNRLYEVLEHYLSARE